MLFLNNVCGPTQKRYREQKVEHNKNIQTHILKYGNRQLNKDNLELITRFCAGFSGLRQAKLVELRTYYEGADKSLARPGRKQATAIKLRICST
jgi:hypothetical protein